MIDTAFTGLAEDAHAVVTQARRTWLSRRLQRRRKPELEPNPVPWVYLTCALITLSAAVAARLT